MEKQWKVIVTDFIEPDLNWEAEQLALPNVTFTTHQLKYAPETEVIESINDADILIVNMTPMNKNVIQRLQKCKLLIRHGVGYDNIDVPALTKKGIILVNLPGYCTQEVAEQAIMLIFATARKLMKQQESMALSVKKGEWDFEMVYPIHQINRKTLGIVGCGRIGSTVLKCMRGFDLNFLVCDPYLTEERKSELDIQTVPLETVLRESDIITIHACLTDKTYHLIGEEQFNMMKSSAFIINTARGSIIDQNALIKACTEKRIAGAAIDVYEYREPPATTSELLRLDNVTLTPHLAWYSVESDWNIRKKIIENVLTFINGKLPHNIVNPEALRR